MPPLFRSKLYLGGSGEEGGRDGVRAVAAGQRGSGRRRRSGRQAAAAGGGGCSHLWKSAPLTHFLFQWNWEANSPQKPCRGGQQGR